MHRSRASPRWGGLLPASLSLRPCRLSTRSIPQAELVEIAGAIPPERIRNFCIISHVDHGKSTLADRMMEITSAVDASQGQAQMLDSLAVERKRGITIKAQTVSLLHTDPETGEPWVLNLIDTPGHVDFS